MEVAQKVQNLVCSLRASTVGAERLEVGDRSQGCRSWRHSKVDFYLLPPEPRWLPDGYEDDDVQVIGRPMHALLCYDATRCHISLADVETRPTERRFPVCWSFWRSSGGPLSSAGVFLLLFS